MGKYNISMRGLFDTNRKKNYIEWDGNISQTYKKRPLKENWKEKRKICLLYENKQLVSCFVFITGINFYTKRDVEKQRLIVRIKYIPDQVLWNNSNLK